MNVTLRERTEDTVRVYFEKAQRPEIKKTLPQKAKTLEEALADFERTQMPGTTSFGKTIHVDDRYVGDVWCYCMDLEEEPNCMVSYCVFETELWSRGIATMPLGLFLENIRDKFGVASVGAFTYADHGASVRVLQKNGFAVMEEFVEDGIKSVYLQRDF